MNEAKSTEQISGRVHKIFFKDEAKDFAIFELIDDRFGKYQRVAGTCVTLYEGDSVVCYGAWGEYKGEKQFKARQVVTYVPVDREAIEAFLGSGRIKTIGPKMAKTLVRSFGVDTLDVIENEPDRVCRLDGIGKKRIEHLQSAVISERNYVRTIAFFQQCGIPTVYANKLTDFFRGDPVESIKKDPFKLLELIPALGFARVDRIALNCGIAVDSDRRVDHGLFHCFHIESARSGSTWINRDHLVSKTHQMLLKNDPDEILEADCVSEGLKRCLNTEEGFCERDSDNGCLISTQKLDECEQLIVDSLQDLSESPSMVSCSNHPSGSVSKDIELDDSQSAALEVIKANSVTILTGGPGTGKSTILKQLIHDVLRVTALTSDDVLLCAPTGKAARRMTESTGMIAQTIHRALGVGDFGEFGHNQDNPLEQRLVLVDESSMVDTPLAGALFSAVPRGAHLVIIGDCDQLPSVGPGAVLGDLMDSGIVPVVRLTEPHRFAGKSRIITHSRLIAQQKIPDIEHDEENDFWFIRESGSGEKIRQRIMGLIPRLSQYYGISAFDDIQILTPQRKGAVGSFELNDAVQGLHGLSAQRIEIKNPIKNFHIGCGDRVMETVNRGAEGPFNGDVGLAETVNPKQKNAQVEIDGVSVDYSSADCTDLLLAYAMTIHKSQGSEYPFVIIPITFEHRFMLNWKLLYTAITRAKKHVVLVGDWRAFCYAIKSDADNHRVTGIAHRIPEIQKEKELDYA